MSTILSKLENERIVSFTVIPKDNIIIASEECDTHFALALTKIEMVQLITELTKLTNQLKDSHEKSN